MKVGDKVRVIRGNYPVTSIGSEGTVRRINEGGERVEIFFHLIKNPNYSSGTYIISPRDVQVIPKVSPIKKTATLKEVIDYAVRTIKGGD